MIAIFDEYGEVLLQLVNGSYDDDNIWYLDRSASSHIIGKKAFLQSINESKQGTMRFNDGSTIRYEGKVIFFSFSRTMKRW